jgi:hypothetical protein
MPTIGAFDGVSSWVETQYCASIAAALLARTEYFELLEDACIPPGRVRRALSAWQGHVSQAQALARFPGVTDEGFAG